MTPLEFRYPFELRRVVWRTVKGSPCVEDAMLPQAARARVAELHALGVYAFHVRADIAVDTVKDLAVAWRGVRAK